MLGHPVGLDVGELLSVGPAVGLFWVAVCRWLTCRTRRLVGHSLVDLWVSMLEQTLGHQSEDHQSVVLSG